ncbi:MAG: ABC transporter permease subunit [Phycisphaeraceae bacterium]|nr:ABC transporter permease subunit [Phycisphaeraceae bacterium]
MPVFLRWLLALGPLNPIAVRIVQNASRRDRHHYIRTAYLGVLIAVLLWALVAKTGAGDLDYRELAQAGARSFIWIAYLQIFLITVLTPVFMAGAIAQEANPNTWEILLTTPLNRAQIVLGNLLGRLFFVIALLAASLPLFALTQYFGGVPGRSIFASYLVAACAALAVGSIAVALSVSRIAGRRAVFAFYVAVVSYLAVTYALDAWVQRSGPGVTRLTSLNPFLTLHALLAPTSYPRGGEGAPWSLRHPVTAFCTGAAVLSLALIVASAITVRTGGLQNLVSGRGGVPWYRRLFKLGGAGAEHRPPRNVWSNPIAWREAAARNATLGRIAARWSFIALGGLFGLGLLILFHVGRMDASTFRFVLLTVVGTEIAVLTLVAINMSSTAVSREREDGTLDLLLTTPITPSAYLMGKLRGLIAYLLPMLAVPLGTLMLAGVYVAAGGLGRPDGVMVQEGFARGTIETPVVLPEAALLAPLIVVPFVAFCVMIGLHWSVKTRGTIGSVVAAFGVVAGIAGTIGLCGWKAGADIQAIGPALAALSPASAIYAMIEPAYGMERTLSESGLGQARVTLAVGAVVAAGVYIGAVHAINAALVRNFDMTVRKLAGMK